MKKKLIICVAILAIVVIAIVALAKPKKTSDENSSGESYPYKISLKADKTTVSPGDELEIKLNLKDVHITTGEKGIGSYQAQIEYDEYTFEDLEFEAAEGWDTPYSQEDKFLSVTSNGECVSDDQEIAIIKLKTKKDADKGDYEIKISNFEGSDAENTIKTNDQKITIKIK